LLASTPRAEDGVMPRDFLQPWAEPIVLFRFRFRDPVSGKWTRARYAAERAQIAARYAEWETVGAPEIRQRTGAAFSPWRA
jgi:hypothetical protein